MLETENTFRALTAADKAAARPWMVRSAMMPRGGFTELAKSSPLANPEQQLRLINGSIRQATSNQPWQLKQWSTVITYVHVMVFLLQWVSQSVHTLNGDIP